jgi:hypothetical protein
VTPCFQRIFEPGRGDCLTAAVASLLDLPYEQVPCWMADAFDRGRAHEWHQDLNRWMATQGFLYVRLETCHLSWPWLPGALCIASMPSQRYPEVLHACVGTWVQEGPGVRFQVLHDPNPNNLPYGADEEPQRVALLVPRDPARLFTVSG